MNECRLFLNVYFCNLVRLPLSSAILTLIIKNAENLQIFSPQSQPQRPFPLNFREAQHGQVQLQHSGEWRHLQNWFSIITLNSSLFFFLFLFSNKIWNEFHTKTTHNESEKDDISFFSICSLIFHVLVHVEI